MRLTKIRIAGFKSFVDPVTLELHSPLVGIVGPNGCGKSNTIDAVRWVMGESSAKHLRGQSMEDVIFNGSSARKPVGQASVELVFDNSAGKLGGEYAQYSEIALKRLATRDGKSHYFLNGSRCRRRDITDIFLGTGLGPRSYAIIEQGMISRLIDAKPDELRTTLEEAAGISRYKERRRETETRISHTRDNLERLNDIRTELGKQLSKLEKQAQAAAHYKTLRQEEHLLAAQLLLVQWDALEQAAAERLAQLTECAERYKTQWQSVREHEQRVETLREQVKTANQSFNTVQGEYYAAGAEIARVEQQLRHQADLEQRQQHTLTQLQTTLDEAHTHRAEDEDALSECIEHITALTPQVSELEQAQIALNQTWQDANQALQHWQTQWDTLHTHLQAPTSIVQQEKARLEQLERQGLQLTQRQTRLQQELTQLASPHTADEQALLTETLDHTRLQRLEVEDQLAALQTQLPAWQTELQTAQQQLATERLGYEQNQARLTALTTLQQAQLHKDNAGLQTWLTQKDWATQPRLAEVLQVEAGWELALELVLRDTLEAVCVPMVQRTVDKGWPEQGVMLLQLSNVESSVAHSELIPLSAKIHAPSSVNSLVAGVYAVETLAEAFQSRTQLNVGESLITQDGFWLGQNWLKAPQKTTSDSSKIQRQQQIQHLQTQTKVQITQLNQLQTQVQTLQTQLKTAEHERQILQQQVNQLHRQESQHTQALTTLLNQQQQLQKQHARLEQDLAEVRLFIEEQQSEFWDATEQRNSAQLELDGYLAEQAALQTQRHSLQTQLNQAQTERETLQTQWQHTRLQLESWKQQHTERQRQLERAHQRIHALNVQYQELQATLKAEHQPLTQWQDELSEALESKALVEMRLKSARQAMEASETAVLEQDRKRLQAEQLAEATRTEQEQLKLAWQTLNVKVQDAAEQFSALDYERETLRAQTATYSEQGLTEQLVSVRQKIARLGAINLAAIEEFESLTERKVYLDQQNDDLVQALETLEAAMRKIDKETRTRFKETFERVNEQLSVMFPRLFGGGECHLHMTEQDWLTTGVAIMVRPPGKRISNIQLLSGGEKALTAVALVFAIFELNPAPFCMLDEVDAPLDEANVGRFAELVRHMSQQVQFIFITHNRVTMELAENLIGVTMREPGVSRLVAVDVAKAVQFANG